MNEASLEEKLQWLSPIPRCNIVCGFYGDTQWEVWNDHGTYVEHADHEEIVNIYKDEIARLRKEMSSES